MADSDDKPSAEVPPKAQATDAEDPTGSREEAIETVESESTKKTSTNPSEYDSADSFSDAEGDNGQPQDQDHESAEGSEGSGSVTLEREEGDGQESVQSKKVDDDEDKKNPQYIPKRGTFYEHDDRTAEDNEETAEDPEKDKDKEGKKKIWTDKKEKWSHDKFNDNDQAPKSKQELVAIYGYDIRNEDGPPRARRRRRYGRGPNKYTRNWEDEDAYTKAPPLTKKPIVKKNRSKHDEQEQDETETVELERHNRTNSEEANSSGRQSTENSIESKNEQYSHQTKQPREFTPRANHSNTERDRERSDRYNSNKNQRVGTGRIVKPNREIRDSDYQGFTKPRQFTKSHAHAPQNQNVNDDSLQSRNYTNRRHVDLEKDMNRMSLNEPAHKSKQLPPHANRHHQNAQQQQRQQPQQQEQQGPVPPRLQTEQKGSSKRYSSIRQRSLPESSNSNYNQQGHGYYNDYQQQSGSQPSAPPPQAPQPIIQPMQSQMPAIPPPPLPTIPAQVPVTTTPLPPQFANPFPQPPPPFLQPAPPPFIPQPSGPPMLNYVQGQPPYAPPQGAFPGYQQQFNPVSQPTEIFQPPGGITYYSTQEQQAAQQRAAIQKRPKAAIPIVPPPPHEPRGRGRIIQENSQQHEAGDAQISAHIESNATVMYEDVPVQP